MVKFEDAYNAGKFAECAANYMETCEIIVNGETDKKMVTPDAFAKFLEDLSKGGSTSIKFEVTQSDGAEMTSEVALICTASPLTAAACNRTSGLVTTGQVDAVLSG